MFVIPPSKNKKINKRPKGGALFGRDGLYGVTPTLPLFHTG